VDVAVAEDDVPCLEHGQDLLLVAIREIRRVDRQKVVGVRSNRRLAFLVASMTSGLEFHSLKKTRHPRPTSHL
jgi:hypothetical protein